MAELVGNLLVAQSGGPTSVINASVAGVIQEAGKHGLIEEIYAGLNGIYGILNEDLIDLNEEKARAIEGLKHTPLEYVAQGRDLATRLRDSIKGFYGRTGEMLVEFRIPPRRPRTAPKATAPPQPSNAPLQPSTA